MARHLETNVYRTNLDGLEKWCGWFDRWREKIGKRRKESYDYFATREDYNRELQLVTKIRKADGTFSLQW